MGGEGEMYGKNNMETYTIICKIDSQREFAVWLRKLKQGLCVSLRGWDGEEGGREVQKGGDICIPMADSYWGLTKQQNSVKQLSFNSFLNFFLFWCGPFLKSLRNLLQYCFCFMFFGPEACGTLVPWSEIKPTPPEWEGKVFKHWTTTEVQHQFLML